MATASLDRGRLWTDLEGHELPGGWRLKRLVRPEGRSAWFEATGPDGKPAMISLTEALNDEEELLARLRAAAAIRHPNVVAIWAAQLARVDDTPLVMAAMESTDENLAEVLRERTLDATEARTLLEALLKGLAAIHARRLAHGRMEAGSVLAIGDTVKLRSDCLRLESFAAGAAEDVRGVGRIVTQTLTRRIPANENDPVLQRLPDSIALAVRRALSGEATVEEVAALAGTRMATAPEARTEPPVRRSSAEALRVAASMAPAIRKPEESPKTEERKTEEPGPEKRPATVFAMRPAETAAEQKAAQMDLPLIPRAKKDAEAYEDEERGKEGLLGRWNYHRRGAPWIVAAAVCLILATVVVLHGWLHGGSAAKPVPASPRVVVERAAPVAPVQAARRAGAGRVWRVVVYTYRHRAQAEQRARDLSRRYPRLSPGVLATRGGDFLVTLGGTMSREEAMALRGRAVRMGLPRDTYAQNFR
jgi:hypothetical protein